MTASLESRLRQLEDRAQISETVIRYAMGVDRRDDLVGLVRDSLSGFTATQHLSPNHVIEFSPTDPDRATCHSYMYAQHYLENSAGGDFYLLRGSYTSQLLRTPDGWRIEILVQQVGWQEGNLNALTESRARYQADRAAAKPPA